MTALIDARQDERDRGLVERHQSGDSSAFAELYTLHYGRLIRFCRRLVRDPHIAEEIAQDAFLRAFTTLDRLQGERRFYPWLTVIARRLVIDHVRRHGRVQPRSLVEPAHAGAAEDVAVERMEGGHLLTALERVRDRHREVLRLRDWEGLSYEAIAERMGVAPTAVPPLLHRARAALRREYLLVTEGRVAAFLHLPALLALVRRARDRWAVWSTWLPDASAISAPVAGMVLSIGTMTGALGAGALVEPTPFEPAPPMVQPVDDARAAGAREADLPAGAREPLDGATRPSGAAEIVPGVVAGSVTGADGDGTKRVSRDGHGKPVFIDTQYVGVWLDPEEDARRLERQLESSP